MFGEGRTGSVFGWSPGGDNGPGATHGNKLMLGNQGTLTFGPIVPSAGSCQRNNRSGAAARLDVIMSMRVGRHLFLSPLLHVIGLKVQAGFAGS
jgi:hypothetical protein